MFMVLEGSTVVAYCSLESDARALCETHDAVRTYVKMMSKESD